MRRVSGPMSLRPARESDAAAAAAVEAERKREIGKEKERYRVLFIARVGLLTSRRTRSNLRTGFSRAN